MRWAVIFNDSVEMLNIRVNKQLRDAHTKFAINHPELLIGGGLKPDKDQEFCGALWIVQADTKQQVIDLIHLDPFFYPEYRSYEIFTWGKILENQTAIL